MTLRDTEDSLNLQKDVDILRRWVRNSGTRFQPVKYNIIQITRRRTNKIQTSNTLEGTVLKIWLPFNTKEW